MEPRPRARWWRHRTPRHREPRLRACGALRGERVEASESHAGERRRLRPRAVAGAFVLRGPGTASCCDTVGPVAPVTVNAGPVFCCAGGQGAGATVTSTVNTLRKARPGRQREPGDGSRVFRRPPTCRMRDLIRRRVSLSRLHREDFVQDVIQLALDLPSARLQFRRTFDQVSKLRLWFGHT